MLLASVALFFSCEKQDVRLHTTIHEDGTCKREVIYRNVMPQEERDSLWGKDSTSAPLAPVPECVNMEGFMGSHTDIGENDTVTTTLEYQEFKDVKEMCQYTPLQLNGARLKSNANLEKHFRWFYTEYTYTETFNTVADTFKLSPTDYADKDVVSYWFTGQPNLLEGLSGGQASEKISKMEPFVSLQDVLRLHGTALRLHSESPREQGTVRGIARFAPPRAPEGRARYCQCES